MRLQEVGRLEALAVYHTRALRAMLTEACDITGGFVSNQNGPYGTECATPAACVVLPGSNGSCPTMYAMQFGHMAHTSIVVLIAAVLTAVAERMLR